MKYPNENDSYITWLKHCCKVLMTTWKRVDCAKDALDKIVAGIKELFSGAVDLLAWSCTCCIRSANCVLWT